MFKHIDKRVMAPYDHGIDQWDEPTVRYRSDGTKVVGRPTRGFGDGGTFSYAGKDYTPEPWTKKLFLIREQSERIVSETLGREVKFTFCLAGLYPKGDDGIPHHSDTVPTMDDLVFSISYGAPRIFVWREYNKSVKTRCNTSDLDTVSMDEAAYKDANYLVSHGDAF